MASVACHTVDGRRKIPCLAKALSADFGLPYTKVTCFADIDKSDVLGSILPVLPEDENKTVGVTYKYYPSEIVRAYENGWLLEIQEPTVIRDAAVREPCSERLFRTALSWQTYHKDNLSEGRFSCQRGILFRLLS